MSDPKIPGWLTKLAGTAKHLPLSARQKMLPIVVGQLHKSGLLSELTGDELSQSAVYMAHFLGGSGEPLELDISEKDWKALIRETSEPPMDKQEWIPSTNPKFPKEEGWEWKQISPYYSDFRPKLMDHSLYHILGTTTTLRRRKVGKDKYEYQIAEDFDLTRGTSGKEFKSQRNLPAGVSKIIEAVFPEYTEDISESIVEGEWEAKRNLGEIMTTKELSGVPVPIKSSYIHSIKTEDMVMDSMTEEEGIFK